ncbi:Tm-1-like ATP-binding domain-containing protein [Paenibacillus sp. HJGM_3]|uniref:Tm-1-like ATP-binding domain-containing protein n=1 Tax=Paenibacillus sp. HJGM_3 TaxID=3379816 RepID=UPI00385DE22B
MSKTIALLGSLDTKGVEYGFIKKRIQERGHRTLLIDTGVLDEPALLPDIPRESVALAAGGEIADLRTRRDRGEAVAIMGRGAELTLMRLYREGAIDGVIALGGTGGTSVACQAMRSLPVGFPKVMVSTVAGSDVSGYVDGKDIVMIPSIVDIAGINRISRTILARAAGAICGMAEAVIPEAQDHPLIAASMFGNTTRAVEAAKAVLEQADYEVLVFHCTGAGGRTMESLVEAGMIAGVLDITTTEWADELVGGVFSAGAARLEAAARCGVPAIVVPGCLDMVNFWAPDTIPDKFRERLFYRHNPNVTLMRTNIEENRMLGQILAEKLNASQAPVTVLLPLQGISLIGEHGGPFGWPEADRALFDSLREHLRPDIPVVEMECTVNASSFAERCAEELLKNMGLTR